MCSVNKGAYGTRGTNGKNPISGRHFPLIILNIMLYTITVKEVLSQRRIFRLMLRIACGYMTAGLANIDGSISITSDFIYHLRFQILVKKKILGLANNFLPFWL